MVDLRANRNKHWHQQAIPHPRRKGKEKNQGIGYLSDGTMIVVEGAKDKVDEKVMIKVSKVIQSPAGKMIFAKVA